MQIRDLAPADLDAALRLNEAALPAVNSHDAESLATLVSQADRCWVATDENTLAGLLVSFAPGSEYTSAHYRWLQKRFEQFRYVDRIIISPTHKRRGLGSKLYAVLEAHALAQHATRLLCEVNVVPANPQSIAFHERSGWTAVSDRTLRADKVVRYFEKTLVDT
ncbi:MAG: GNAT family N-acetyltransferase [Nannocystales bacterium]